MTYNESTTPSIDTEPAPRSCGDDPLDIGNIPVFLRRTPQPTKPAGVGKAMRSTPDRESRS